jgi:hypothetical protein
MRPDGPAPSAHSLLSSWLSLTGWMIALCAERAHDLIEGGHDRLGDAVADVGCQAAEGRNDAGDLPALDPDAFADALLERAAEALRRAAAVINEEPNACLEAVTRDRVQTLFRLLADEALAYAMEQRIAAAEAVRGEADSPEWVRRYRRILAAEGRWPPAEEPATTVAE